MYMYMYPPVELLCYLTTILELSDEWNAVGDHLGVPVSEMDAIQENNRRGGEVMCRGCLRDVIIWWLMNGGEDTARKLVKAVHKVGVHSAEKEIYQRYGKCCK